MKTLKYIPTLGPIGYLPAPGTWGTAVALFALYAIKFNHYSWLTQCAATTVMFVVSSLLISYLLRYFDSRDPSEIVLDEVVGSMAAVCCIAPTVQNYLIAFLLFRIFDIAKPFGIKKLEELPGGWGVVTDDLVAGIVSNLLLQGINYFWF